MIGRLAWRLAIGFALAFLLAPLVMVVLASLTPSAVLAFPPSGLTFHWYRAIPRSYIDALEVSLVVASLTTVVALFLGVPAALALVRSRLPARQALAALCLSPLMVPTLVTGVALFQLSLRAWDLFGFSLGETVTGLVLGHLTFAIPFVIRAVVANLAQFDEAIEEAARNLGAGPLRSFFSVTLGILKPSIISGGIFAFFTSLDDVPIALFMGGGDATTLPVRIFTTIEFSFGGEVMAVASIVIAASLLVMALVDRIVGVDQFLGSRY